MEDRVSRGGYPNHKYAELVTDRGEDACKQFFQQENERFDLDPNTVSYEREAEIKEEVEVEPAEYHVWKRRQRTKEGAENPKSPCDDKGLLLYIDKEGNIVTKANGNKPLWGEWVDGSEEEVSLSTSTIPRGRCWPEVIGGGRYPSTLDRAEELIERDKQRHDAQQGRRKNKVLVEYDVRQTKEEKSYPIWRCSLKLDNKHVFPANWKEVDYDPTKVPDRPDPRLLEKGEMTIDEFMALNKRPIGINLSWKKKNKKGQWAKTGAGNFKGRKQLVADIAKGKLYGRRPLHAELRELGFEEEPSGYSGQSSQFTLPVPGSDGDYCVVKSYWSSYSVPSFGYVTSQVNFERMGVKHGPPYPIGGHREFSKAEFSIQKGYPQGTKHKMVSSHRGGYDMREFEKIEFYGYEEKAPEESVSFCHERFDDLVRNAIVELKDDIPKVYKD